MRSPFALFAIPSLMLGAALGCESPAPPAPAPKPKPKPTQQPSTPIEEEHHYFHKEEKGHKAEWGYDGDKGPAHWGGLDPAYSLASTGKEQSPIDIADADSKKLPTLKFTYHPAKIDLLYNGHTIEEIEEKGSFLSAGDRRYELQQFHFHAPSEHTIDGKHTEMELHLVHKNESGKVAVVAVMIREGAANPAFDPVWSAFPEKIGEEVVKSVQINAADLLPKTHAYYQYQGSFTTPPCTEGVAWYVLKTPVELSVEQIARFKTIIQNNNRPVQPLNGRKIWGS